MNDASKHIFDMCSAMLLAQATQVNPPVTFTCERCNSELTKDELDYILKSGFPYDYYCTNCAYILLK